MVIVTKNEGYVKELDFSEETLDRRMAKALQEQRVTDESFWDSLSTHVRQTVKKIVEGCLEEEVRMMIGASSYEHSPLREGERSGHYKRDLITRYGLIENLLVPKVRKRKYNGFKVLKRYARRVGDIDELVKEIFLAGVSTRRVREVIKPLLGYQYSPQFVSDILKQLDKEVRKFHEREISDEYVYLFFDGLTLKIRHGSRVQKRYVLVAYGIKKNGDRDIIDYKFAKGESSEAWESFTNDIYMRGLLGEHLRLITTDGNKGLLNGLDLVYPRVNKQRCWVHKLFNVAKKCPKRLEKTVVASARDIYLAETKPAARRQFKRFKGVWQNIVPDAVRCIEDNLEELLYFFDCPGELWRKLRTTNVIERSFREVRRRIKTINAFTNVESCDRIVYGVINYLNCKWMDKPLLEVLKSEFVKHS